jgi:hypothetical protein
VLRRLSYTDDALTDLAGVTRWLTQPGSGPAARRRLAAIWSAIEQLREQPCLWAVGLHASVRELPCAGGYRALYEVQPDTGHDDTAGDVLVLRIYGPGQSRDRL